MGERVVVVGAGVVGLTAAVRLAERGHRVDVLARDLPLETTSVVAAALWYPYEAHPRQRVHAWSASTYDTLVDLAAEPRTGVRLRSGTEVLRESLPDP
ncbi:FAD-dependent oxidoreductase, partial [Nocardioides sp.]|uniref:FAD-dependent oxidoreductase n=1 Tax=Nocardioides sp. TaxID=35761 RepID=UPI002ED1C79F